MNLIGFMNIFMAICFLPILLLLYVVMRNETKPKNNLILSTTLPKEAWEDSRVSAICKEYRRNLDITCLILFVLYFPVMFTEYISIQLTYIMTWTVAICFAPYIPYYKSVKKMRALKKENWYHPELKKVQVAETSLSSVFEERESTYTFVHFLLPLLVSLIPLLYPLVMPTEHSMFGPYLLILINSATIIIFYLCYRFAFRKKTEHVSSDVTLNMVLTRIRIYYWKKFWLYCSWLSAFLGFSSILLLHTTKGFLVALTLYTIGLFAVILNTELKIRSEQQRLNKEQPSEILVDEDDCWIFGSFYYNKNDSNMMVNARTGFGTTMNMAHPVAKWIYILCAIITISLPFFGIWMMKDEFTEQTVLLTDTAIEAHHLSKEYTVLLNDIVSLELLSELPDSSKSAGTNYPHLYKGLFSVKGISKHCRLCLDPYDELFLVVRTEDKTYIFSEEDTDTIKEVYELWNKRKK